VVAATTRQYDRIGKVAVAARLKVELWRLHRQQQREADLAVDDLTNSVAALYSSLYRVGTGSG